MRLRELLIQEDGEGASASSTATTSSDIANVAYPLLVRGKNKKEKRKNARNAVGQSYNAGPVGVGTGVFEAKSLSKQVKIVQGPDSGKTGWIREIKHGAYKGAPKAYYIDLEGGGQANNLPGRALRLIKSQDVEEAHTLNSDNVIYRLDREHPMSDTEVLILGGAGRYTLSSLRDKARREAKALSDDLTSDHGGSFRGAAHNIKQLTNTLNTIVAAYNELARIRRKGGRGSRGITDEDANFIRECMGTLENYVGHVNRAIAVFEKLNEHLLSEGMNQNHVNSINGMYHLGVDPGYGFYRWSIHVAGNKGGGDAGLGANAGPFAYAYTDEEDKMIRDAVKAMGGKIKSLTPRGSKEDKDVNKNSTVLNTDWKKIK